MQPPPAESVAFEALMEQIDQQLVSNSVDIPSRPMFAIMEVSKRFKIQMRGGPRTKHCTAQEIEEIAYAEAIHQWYERNYKARLNESASRLRTAVLVDGDIYSLRIPWQIGKVEYLSTRKWLENPRIARSPVTINVVQFLDEITPARAERFSDNALKAVWRAFNTAFLAADTLMSTNHKLMSIARGDVETAVANLMAVEKRYGEARWASLQVAEKIIKCAIDLAGVKFKQTHNLKELCQQLAATGLEFEVETQLSVLQCRPGIRYGEEASTQEQALLAHHSSLEFVNIIRKSGGYFNMGIDRD